MTRPRLAFVVTTLVTGGAERVLQHLLLRLRDRFDVELITLREPGPLGEELRAEGVPVFSGLTGHGRLDPLLLPRLRRLLGERRYDAIYFLDHAHAVFYGTIASLGTSVRARVMPVHTTGQWNGAPSLRRPIRMVRGRLDRIIAIAETQKRYLIETEHVPEKQLVVIPNGIPLLQPAEAQRAGECAAVRRELEVEPGALVVGITAVLRPEKNHELLLDAFASVARLHSAAELWIVGDGPRRAELQERASRGGLSSRVRFLGARRDARRLMAGMDLAVLASHPRVETLPLSLLEAMDASQPIVATRVGALAEMVEEGRSGYLVPAGDADALARRIAELLSDPAARAAFGRRGAEIARERYSAERMADATAALLYDLLGVPGPRS